MARDVFRFALLASGFLAFAAACATEQEDSGHVEDRVSTVPAGERTENPASPALPPSILDLARGREIVAIAGTNSSAEARAAFERGEGTAENPLARWQAVEAAVAVAELAGSADDVSVWGYGPAPSGTRPFFRTTSGHVVRLHFLGDASVTPGEGPGILRFGTGQAKDDATRLAQAIADRKVFLVGHSWGGAVVDYGKLTGVLGAPGISLGAPAKLFSNPIQSTRLREGGLHGEGDGRLWVARRPDDPIGGDDVLAVGKALLSGDLSRHDYRLAWHGTPGDAGGVWGVNGTGLLCSASPAPCP